MAVTTVEFTVVGLPVPEGSKNFWRGRVVDSSGQRLTNWRDQIIVSARPFVVANDQPLFEKTPLWADIVFRLPKGTSIPKKRMWPLVKPDLDKLVRAVFDALKLGRLIEDDAQVCKLVTEKTYALGSDMPGATIRIGGL